MGPVHHPTPWFSTTVVFSTSSISGSQNAIAPLPAVGWQNDSSLRELGEDHGQSVGPGCSSGVQTGTGENPVPVTPPSDGGTKEPRRACSPGGANPSRQGSDCPDPSSSRERRVLLNTVLSAKERGPAQAGDQPSSAEQVCKSRAFQNGGDAHRAGPPAGGRLDDTTRFEGCILRNSYTQAPPEVSPIQVEEPALSIPVSPIRSVHSSTDVHQGVTSSDRIVERIGHQVCYLPGRHPHHEPGQRAGSPTDLDSNRLIGVWSTTASRSWIQCRRLYFWDLC
jgi:hypothetical protein